MHTEATMKHGTLDIFGPAANRRDQIREQMVSRGERRCPEIDCFRRPRDDCIDVFASWLDVDGGRYDASRSHTSASLVCTNPWHATGTVQPCAHMPLNTFTA